MPGGAGQASRGAARSAPGCSGSPPTPVSSSVAASPARVLSTDLGPGFTQTADLGQLDSEHLFLEPWADEPGRRR